MIGRFSFVLAGRRIVCELDDTAVWQCADAGVLAFLQTHFNVEDWAHSAAFGDAALYVLQEAAGRMGGEGVQVNPEPADDTPEGAEN